MQGSFLFPQASTPSNDGPNFPRSSLLVDGSGVGLLSTPGTEKIPAGGDPWGTGSLFGNKTPGTGGLGLGANTPAATPGTTTQQFPRSAGRTPSRPISLLMHDMATPISQSRNEYSSSRTPGGSAFNAWSRSNSGGAAPPPPPIETLGDFIERTPEAATPPTQQGMHGSPPQMNGIYGSPGNYFWDMNGRQSWGPDGLLSPGGEQKAGNQTPWRALSFRDRAASPERSPMADSPVSGVVQQGLTQGLSQGLSLTMQQGLALNVPQSRQGEAGRSMEDNRWVTVYGFGPDDTNLVLREFERCGTVTEHVFGPQGSNWMHLQYQNMYDARKALSKNGAQLTGSLIVGVKPLDPKLRATISRRAEDTVPTQQNGLTTSVSRTTFGPGPKTPGPAYRPYHLESIDGPAKTPGVAQPNQSTLTKVLDFLFSA